MNSKSKLRNLAFLAYFIFSLAVISYVPKLIPLQPNAADSYLFGYNNSAGIMLVLTLIGAGVLWTKGLNLDFLASCKPRSVSNTTLILALVAVFCGCVSMYMFAGRYGGFGESYYLIDRIVLLSDGKVPYRDFEFAYGPGLLYGPLLLKSFLSLDIPQAYYLFWLINCLLGTLLLFKSVNMVNYPTGAKEDIFLLLFLAGLFSVVRMGSNYTFLRFACPVFLVIVIQGLFRDAAPRARVGAVLSSVAFAAILILISPETTIAFAFASICICLFSRSGRGLQRGITISALLLGFSAISWAAWKVGILDTLLVDGRGADSFPILVSPHILLYLAVLFVGACYIFRRYRNRRIDDNTFGLVAFSLPMVVAALSRCDPVHVFWNGLAIFLATMCYISTHDRAWRFYKVAFVLFSFFLPVVTELFFFYGPLRQVGAFNAQGLNFQDSLNLDTLYPTWSGGFLAPFGYRPGGLGTYRSSRIEYGRFEELINVSAPTSVTKKLDELKRYPDRALILPYNFEDLCEGNVDLRRTYIRIVFLSPYGGRVVHPESVYHPLCDYIQTRYRLESEPAAREYWFGLWVPKPDAKTSH